MDSSRKIVSIKQLLAKLKFLKRARKTIAFTNGCFDILHMGHVSYLEKAKQSGRVFVIGLNSDSSVRKLKGPKRPIVSQNARARVLAGLACVDFVTIFNEETPLKLIAQVKPDVLIKGADWKGKEVAGADVVKKNGGRVEFIKFVNNFSTTNIIGSILEKCACQ